MTRIATVALDMAGTTVSDDGLVLNAFNRAFKRVLPEATKAQRADALAYVVETMGQSKIDVFRALVDEETAQALNDAFEAAVEELIREGLVTAIPGAEEAIRQLKADGRSVVLTTGFARPTADAIIDALGWHRLPDAVITPADAGRGRPAPDMNLLALHHTGTASPSALAVVGDTPSDVTAGVDANAGLVVAVLSGDHTDERTLRAAGANTVIPSVADLPELLNAHDSA